MVIEVQLVKTFKEKIRLTKYYLRYGYDIEILADKFGEEIVYATKEVMYGTDNVIQ